MEKSGKFFKKGNKFRYKPQGERTLDAHIGLKLTKEDKLALQSIPNWSEKLRDAIKLMIQNNCEST